MELSFVKQNVLQRRVGKLLLPTADKIKQIGATLACVASVSNRAKVIAEAKKRLKGEGRRANACPQTPRFWRTPLGISRFGSFVN